MVKVKELRAAVKNAKLIAFDLDGTLLNTIDDLAYACNHTLEVSGYPTRTLDEVRRFVGNGIPKLIERALPKPVSEAEFAKLVEIFNAYYAEHLWDYSVEYDGISELIEEFRAQGKILVVLTNKNEILAKKIVQHFYPGIFVKVLGDNPEKQLKPDPSYYYEALEELQIAPEETILIGDSDTDVKTAVNSDAYGIGAEWGYRNAEVLAENGADIIIENPIKLLELLRDNNCTKTYC